MQTVELLPAFIAGIISFISPCVLPLIPGYLSYISGISYDEIQQADSKTQLFILYRAVLFCLGFVIVFTALGVAASFLGVTIASYRIILEKIAGFMIVIMGFFVAGVLELPFINMNARVSFNKLPSGNFGAFLLGTAFAVAWTPCVGPILSSILFYASTVDTIAKGGFLLFIYSLGLAVPLILTAVFFNRMLSVFSWIKKRYQVIMALSGGLLILMGLSMIFGKFGYFNMMLQKLYYQLNFNPF